MRKILFYGDSNTYGYDPRQFSAGRYDDDIIWTTRLANVLAGEWEVLADGRNGRPIPRLKYDKAYLDRLIEQTQPLDVFAVMLGTNDILFNIEPSAKKAVAMMEEFVQYLLEQMAKYGFDILLIAPIWIGHDKITDPTYMHFRAESKVLNAGYKELAEKYQIKFTDAGEWDIDLASDFTHFSEEGHREFAERIVQYLNSTIAF